MCSLLVAQLTDTHLFADRHQTMLGCPTAHTLQAVVKRLKQLPQQPDLLLLTGDLSQDETPQSYEQLQGWITPLNIPTYWIPGNHDVVSVMASRLSVPPLSAQKSIQQGGWHLVLLNSAVPGRVEGELATDTLTWLEQQLQKWELPTLVVLHHHPVPIGSAWMDAIGLQQPEAFLERIDRFPQVKLVLFGHIHQEFATQRNGVWYLGSPSTCVQFSPHCDRMKIDDQPAGFRLLSLEAEGNFSTRIERAQVSSLT